MPAAISCWICISSGVVASNNASVCAVVGFAPTIASVTWAVKSTSYTTQTTLASGQTLTTASSGAVTDSIQNVSQTNTPSGAATVATINIAGGTVNEEYTFFCTMTDSTGSTAQRSIKLKIREK